MRTAALAVTGLLFAGAALLAGAAWAQEIPWVQIDLGGGFAMDIPAMLAARVLPGEGEPKDVMMRFGVSAGDPGTLNCQLQRAPYSADLTRQTLASSLAKGDMGDFCKISRPGVSNQQSGSPIAGLTDGMPSATCLTAYTQANEEAAGRVLTMHVVAGKKNFYELVCINAFDDQDGAVTAYASRWSPLITRMQQSFQLAAEEK
jgi:hypothetical protein